MSEIYKYTIKAFNIGLLSVFIFFVNHCVKKYFNRLAFTIYNFIIFTQVNNFLFINNIVFLMFSDFKTKIKGRNIYISAFFINKNLV